MRRILVLMAAMGLGMLLGTGMAQAQDGDDDAQDWGPPRLERMAQHLDLSEEQVDKIRSIHEEAKAGFVQKRKEMMRLHNELEGEMLKDEPNLTEVRQIATQIGDIRTQMQISRFESQLAVRKVLKPEQRDKFLMMKQHARRGGRDCAGPRGSGGMHGPDDMRGPGGPGCGRGMIGPDGPGCDMRRGPDGHGRHGH